MGITFTPEATELSLLVLDYRIVCVADPVEAGGDPRRFTTHERATAALATHSRFCRDDWCWPEAPHVVARTAGEHEPLLQVSNSNGAFLLRALGLVAELGAQDECGHAGGPAEGEPAHFPWCGEITAARMLERIALTRALHPEDAGVPAHTRGRAERFIDCGRRPGYLTESLDRLEQVASYAHCAHRRVVWH